VQPLSSSLPIVPSPLQSCLRFCCSPRRQVPPGCKEGPVYLSGRRRNESRRFLDREEKPASVALLRSSSLIASPRWPSTSAGVGLRDHQDSERQYHFAIDRGLCVWGKLPYSGVNASLGAASCEGNRRCAAITESTISPQLMQRHSKNSLPHDPSPKSSNPLKHHQSPTAWAFHRMSP